MEEKSTVELVKSWVTKDDFKWGAYDNKGNHAVNNAMQFAANSMLGLVTEEADNPNARRSLGKRMIIIEDAISRYRMAVDQCEGSGISDTYVREHVHGYLRHVLISSGVPEQLGRDIMATVRLN